MTFIVRQNRFDATCYLYINEKKSLLDNKTFKTIGIFTVKKEALAYIAEQTIEQLLLRGTNK